VLVSEVYDEVKLVLGKCSPDVIFRRITDAVRLGNNQGIFDATLGILETQVFNGTITLPPEVGTLLAVNHNGLPTLIRDQWFQFHANGPGATLFQPWTYTDELGPVVTYQDPQFPFSVSAVVENPSDSNCNLRILGWDPNNKRIYTPDANGNMQDGFLVPTSYGFTTSNPNCPAVGRIDRVIKDVTQGYIQLFANNIYNQNVALQIGYYQPWETVPAYRRIRVPNGTFLSIKYKRKDLVVRGCNDWINMDNREALILLVKAVKFRLDNQIDQAKAYEMEGVRLLSNEADQLRPKGLDAPQVIFSEGIDRSYTKDELYLHY
jgi:hypothetical protein